MLAVAGHSLHTGAFLGTLKTSWSVIMVLLLTYGSNLSMTLQTQHAIVLVLAAAPRQECVLQIVNLQFGQTGLPGQNVQNLVEVEREPEIGIARSHCFLQPMHNGLKGRKHLIMEVCH